MDRLEEYIRKKRDDLDIYKPSPGLWRGIKKDLKRDRQPFRQWGSVAATVAVITATSVIFYLIGKGSRNNDGSLISGRGFTVVSSQLKEAETYYSNQINLLYREAAPMLTGYPELKCELESDISQIDSIYAVLRKDLRDNIANQDVVEALIQNYMIKIKILKEMLVILKENENNPEKSRSYEL